MNKLFKISFLVVLIFGLYSHRGWAQKYVDEETSFADRLYFGGNVGLQLGSYTHIEASPIVGYMVNQNLSVGVGAIYQYFKIKGTNQVGDYETNIYGGKLFGRYNFTSQFFAYTEYENINLDVIFNTPQGYELGRAWVPAYFVGAGYFQPIGGRAGISAMILYNLLHNPSRSPYNSPFVFRVGFSI